MYRSQVSQVQMYQCLISIDSDVERNITSSDIEFLEDNEDKGETKGMKLKNKPESTRVSIDKVRRALVDVNTDVSVKRKPDDYGNNKM
jgi:hypothetical protein